MAIDPNVLDETKKQKATEPDSLASYIDSYRQRGGLALGNPFQQQETTRQEEPGFFQNVAGDVAGGIIDYGEMMGRAGRAIPGGDSAGVDEGGISSKVIGWAEQFKKDNPWADRKDREGLSRWFHEGLRSAVTSLAAGVPGAAVGAAAGTTFGPVGTFLGGLAGYALSGATTFGMAEYDSFLQEADAKGISREESEPMAILSAGAEGGFEFLGDLLQGATLGGTSVVTAPGKAALKTTVKEMLKLNAKQALKRAPIGMGFETGSELLTAGVQTEAQRKIGLTDQKFFDGATQAFGPSLVASAIFQAVGFGGVALNQRAARNTLANADADPEQRLGMVQAVDKAIREQNPELADRWNRTATEAVLKKEALDLDTEIGELPSGQPSETPPPGPRPTRLSALNQIEEEIFQLQSSERDPATGRPAPKNADHYAQLDDLERRKQTLLESLTPEESADHTMSVVNKEVNQLRSELGLPVHSAMAEDESVSSATGATRSKTLLPDEMQTTQSRPQAPYGTISEYEGVGTQTVEKVAGQAPQTAQSRLTEVEQKIANLNSVPETARSPKMQENLQRLEEEKTNLERVLFEQPGNVSPQSPQSPNILFAEDEVSGLGGQQTSSQGEVDTRIPGTERTLAAISRIDEQLSQLRSSERDIFTGRPVPKGPEHAATIQALEQQKQALMNSLPNEPSLSVQAGQGRSQATMAEDERISSDVKGTPTREDAQTRLAEVKRKIANIEKTPEKVRSPNMLQNLQSLKAEETALTNLFTEPGNVSPAGRQVPNILYAEEEGIGGVGQTPASTNPQEISNKLADKEVSADLPSAGTVTAPLGEASQKQPWEMTREGQETASFEEMVSAAAKWQGAHINAEKALSDIGDKKGAFQVTRTSGKSYLDDWLMKRFGIDRAIAHDISNYITAQNIAPDKTANLQEYAGEEWADKALVQKGQVVAPKSANKTEFNPDDLDREKVIRGYSHTSRDPSGVAKMEQQSYVEFMEELRDDMLKDLPEGKEDILNAELQRVKDAYLKRRYSVLNVRGNTVSSMIAGKSKFNFKQAESRNNALDKAEKNFDDWLKQVKQDVAKKTGVADVRAKRKTDETISKQQAVEATRKKEKEVKAEQNKLPIINYPGERTKTITSEEWNKTSKDYKSILVSDDGTYRYRSMMREGGLFPVFLSDKKETRPKILTSSSVADQELAKTSPDYSDPRLKRKEFRDIIGGYTDSITTAGKNPTSFVDLGAEGTQVIRHGSVHPPLIQKAIATAGSVKDLRNAVRKAANGDKLGTRQAEAVKLVLDQMQEEVNSVREGEVRNVRGKQTELRSRRDAFQETAQPATGEELEATRKSGENARAEQIADDFYVPPAEESNEYPAEWDAETKTLADLYAEARKHDRETADALLERQAEDSEIATQLWEIIQDGRKGEGSSQVVQGEGFSLKGEAQKRQAREEEQLGLSGIKAAKPEFGKRPDLDKGRENVERLPLADEIAEKKADAAQQDLFGVADQNPTKSQSKQNAPTQTTWNSIDGKKTVIGQAKNRPDGWLEIAIEGSDIREYRHSDDLHGIIADDEKQFGVKREEDGKVNAEQNKKEAQKSDNMGGFLDITDPKRSGQVRKALGKLYSVKGRPTSLRKHIENLSEQGSLETDTLQEPKIKPLSDRQFFQATTEEQKEHAKRMAEAGEKTIYLVNGSDYGKIAYDYANFLLNSKKAQQNETSVADQNPASVTDKEGSVAPVSDKIKPDAPISRTAHDVSVDDTIYLQDDYENKRHPVNFRGWVDNDTAMVIYDGWQMSFDRERLFKNDLASNDVASASDKEVTTKTTKTKDGEQTKGTEQKIEDFGEEIGGARKMLYAEAYGDKLKEAKDVDVSAAPLSKSWPEPDYAKLLEGGMDSWSVSFIRSLRDQIPTKPQKRWKLSGWAKAVNDLRDLSEKVLSGEFTRSVIEENLKKSESLFNDLMGKTELYEAVGHEQSLKDFRVKAGQYTLYEGVKYDTPKTIWTVEKPAKATAFSNWPQTLAKGETREEVIAAFKKNFANIKNDKTDKQVSFAIYQKRGEDGAFIGKKIGKDYVDLEKFDTITEARKYLKENNDKLTEKLGKFKEVPNERKESNSPRVGEDHRNDADITPEIFSETFGFRGVQFGNYVEGKKRQEDLNQAYDALMDLAGVLGVEPKALSLNGELGLAFGARGTGGRLAGGAAAAAHYESGRVVINLTKNRGAGSLAHEWWHGLDNYFSRMRGDKGNYLTRQATPSEGVRPEMVRAFMRVMNAIAETGMQKRAALLDKTLTRPYWGTKIEMSARSFESYVIAKLQDQGASNDYLANIVSPEYWDAAVALGMEKKGSYPYPSPAEVPAIRAAFDEFFREIETKKTDKGVALFSQAETTNDKLKEDVDRLKNRVETLKAKFTKQEVESEVKRLTSKWKNAPKITVIESVGELPGDIKDQALSMPDGDKIEGVYIPGPNGIFIISSNMPNTKRIEEIIVHEAIGHHGIESIVDQKEFFNILLQLSLVRPEELNKVAEGYGFSLTNKEERLSAAKEVLARMAERGESNGFIRRTIALIKDALRRLGFELEYTDTDFKALIAKGRKFVEKGVTVSGKKAGLAQFAAAWHGTPHKFDKFSTEFVGAGEGNQAYGWGLYFASAKEVAEHYKEKLSESTIADDDTIAARYAREGVFDAGEFERISAQISKKAVSVGEESPGVDYYKFSDGSRIIADEENGSFFPVNSSGRLYQVELAPSEDEYLLWDKPITEQSAKVRTAINKNLSKDADSMLWYDWVLSAKKRGLTGEEFYKEMAGFPGEDGNVTNSTTGMYDNGPHDKAASEYLHSIGIRGIKYLDGTSRGKGEGDFNYVIFDDNDVEIKAQFSRPTADIISEKFDTPQAHSWTSAIKGAFDASKWTKDQAKKYLDDARTKVLDRLHPVEQLGQKAYRLHRMLGNTHAVLATFLQHGKLQWKQGALSVATKDKGFLPWLHALGDDGQKLFYWMAAKRAEVLDREGRENWLDKDARNRIYDEAVFNDLTPAQRREKEQRFETLNKEFQEFNQNIIRIAKESGLISDEQIDSWTKDYYLPFYRLLENEATHDEFLQGPRKAKQHISAQIKRLKGGEEKLGNPVENVLRNWSHLIQESQRNVARSEAATVSVDMGIGRIVPKSEMVNIFGSTKTTRWGVQRDGTTRVERYFDDKDIADGFANMRSQETGKAYSVQERVDTNVRFGTPKDHQIISYQKNGETTYLRVEDPDLFEALAEVNAKAFDSKALKLMSGAKRLLTAGATFTPAFRVANLLRDSLHTAVVAKSFTPFIDSAKGVLKVWKQNPDYIELMASGGGFGHGWIDSGDPRAMARSIEKIIKSEGKESRWRILDSPRRMLEFWERVGHASEMAARVQLYTNLKENGVTHMDAAFEARDLLDFHRTGSSNAVRVLAAITPFLNARFQGLDRLYRGAKNDPKGFMVKGALVAAASLALWAAFEDDDRYKELEDWEKWQYHHFWIGDQHFRIPKAFEVGALFSSMFESSADVLAGNEEAGYFIDFLKHTLTETFAVGMPAAFGPSIEIYANKSAFTGRAIEGMAISRLPAGERANPWTSEMLKDFGKLTGVSPIKAEHILRGHTAAFGAMFLATGDFLWRNVKDAPPSPAPRIDDVPLLGRFVRSPEGRTKYATRYYDFARELSETVAAINNYKALGDVKAAQRLATENKDTLQYKRFVNLTNRQLAGLRKQEKAIWASENLGSSEKRDKLNSIKRKQNEIYKNVYEKIYNDNR